MIAALRQLAGFKSSDLASETSEGKAPRLLALATGAFLVVAVVAGGSASDPGSAMFVRLAAVPLLMMALWRLAQHPPPLSAVVPLVLLALAALLPLAQLVSLPPDVWTKFPGRTSLAEAYEVAGLALPHLPLSLVPTDTRGAALGLLPPMATFLAMLALGPAERVHLVLLVIALAIASVGLSALQLVGGEASPLRYHEITNSNNAVGFFANRNHQASFLASCIPLTAAVGASVHSTSVPHRLMRALFVALAIIVLVLGVAITLSRAGIFLLAPAIVACVIASAGARLDADARGSSAWPSITAAVSMAIALSLVAAFQFSPIAARFAEGEAYRIPVATKVIAASRMYLPLGSGAGSFEKVYQAHESLETLGTAYVNHAHNDASELWLEAGVPGLVWLLAFVVWWANASLGVLRNPSSGRALALGASAVIGMLLLHSLVDYPLRTSAVATLFALASSLLIRMGREERI